MTEHTVSGYEIEVRGDVWDDDSERFKEKRRTFKAILAVNSADAMRKAITEFQKSVRPTPRRPIIHHVTLINISI